MGGPELGENVRYYRKLKGWTQQELADAADINIGSVVALEKSSDGTKLATIYAVAKALQQHPADLFRRSSTEAVPSGEATTAPRIEIPPATLQAAIVGAFRELATAREDSERAHARALIKRAQQRAAAEQAAAHHGPIPTGTTPRAKRRRSGDR